MPTWFDVERKVLGDFFRSVLSYLDRFTFERKVSYVVLLGEVDPRDFKDGTVGQAASRLRHVPPRGSRRGVVHDGDVTLGNNNTVNVNLPIPQGRRRRLAVVRCRNGDSVARTITFNLQVPTTAAGAPPTWQTTAILASDSIGSGADLFWPATAATAGLLRAAAFLPMLRGGDGARHRININYAAGGVSAGGAGRLDVYWEDEPDDGDNTSDDRLTFIDPGV